MNWPWSDTALLRERLKAAELRASVAEAVLASERAIAAERRENWERALIERARAIDAANAERSENRRQERHLTSMFLRREKSFPLPPTAQEKAEAKEQAEEAQKKPPVLSEIEKAMMEANRRDAAMVGVSAEQADEDFMKHRPVFIDD